MKNKLVYILLALLVLTSCQSGNIEKLSDGVIIHLNKKTATDASLVRLQVITDDIIRVTASPVDSFSTKKSLMIADNNLPPVKWNMVKSDDHITVSTSKLNANVSLTTGEVNFTNKDGNVILKENEGGGKTFVPDSIEGKLYYNIRQEFNSPANEAFYGLGQHQNDEMNYKGLDIDLTQHNIVSVVPFLVSSKKYGILWDNYSITKFGDPRDYQNISSLKLYDENEKPGGLTAVYSSTVNPGKNFIKRTDSVIDYQYLQNIKDLPEIKPQLGKVEWKGYIGSDFTGRHKFVAYSSGYTKIWVDGKKVIDDWRQNWNPWYRKFYVNLEKGKKYPVRIEWIPDGGYIALKWLSPLTAEKQNELSLYSEVGNQIDYYFIKGNNLDSVISGYREITGKAPIMPKWAMGLWQSRERYKTQDELLSTVEKFRKDDIPLDNIVLDWFYWPANKWGDHNFDSTRFPDPVGMIKKVHELNAHIMISVWPKFYEGTKNYDYMYKRGWLYKRNIEKNNKDWVGYVSTFYDAFNPQARKYFWEQMDKKLFSKGIDAWWLDATEPDIESNNSIEERKLLMDPTALGPSAEYFNAFSLMNCEAVYDGQRSVDPNKRVFILTRSAYAGQQRYAAATWSGDVASRWYDLKAQIPAGLNFCLSGIPYWTTDIGGFALERRYEKAKGEDLKEWRELNDRWYQFGAFCPLFRVHGQFPLREIYNIAPSDNPVYKSMLYYDNLRYRLMPYIYSLAGKTYFNNYTIMRGLVMDFEADTNVYNIADQYMYGPALMVCPVTEYKARSRKVYLPETSGWYDLYTGKHYNGGQTLDAEAPIERIPVYVKEGSIIPFGPAIQYADEPTDGSVILYVYEGADGVFTLYEDENVNYDYEKGIYSTIPISYNESAHTLTIGERKGTFPGMHEKRTFRIISVNKNSPEALNFEKEGKTVAYDGQSQTIQLN